MHLPFKISPAAEERLANAAAVPNMEPGIVRELSFEVYNKAGQTHLNLSRSATF